MAAALAMRRVVTTAVMKVFETAGLRERKTAAQMVCWKGSRKVAGKV